MSFDTTFNYTDTKAFLDSRITRYTDLITDLNTDITNLQGISGYDTYVAPQITTKTKTKTSYTTKCDECQAIRDEIDVIESLNSADKSTLYNFYLTASQDAQNFMARLLFNHTALLADSNITGLSNDSTLTSDQKATIGSLICEQCPIDSRVNRSYIQ